MAAPTTGEWIQIADMANQSALQWFATAKGTEIAQRPGAPASDFLPGMVNSPFGAISLGGVAIIVVALVGLIVVMRK